MKQLIINKEHPDGIIVEVEDVVNEIPQLAYEDRVINRIHSAYSLDDEIALLWKDPNDPEVVAYRAFVEQIKIEERGKSND